MSVKPAGRFILIRPQPENTLSPKLVKPAGSTKLVRLLQSRNALDPILTNLSGSSTSDTLLHPQNA